jgi:hypothetical protein
MAEVFKVFYVKEFPIARITDCGEEGWYQMPQHLRYRYDFLGAILEHIDNTFCEPIQITMRDDRTVTAGPSGVTRLYALRTLRDWISIPAIVSTTSTPEWLDVSEPVTSREQLRSYYRLEPADYGFTEDGRVYHRNYNPNSEQVAATMVVRDDTKARVIAMLEEEAKR